MNGKALMRCKFCPDKNKWIPIEESKNNKIPDLLSNIEKYLELIIDSDSEEEME